MRYQEGIALLLAVCLAGISPCRGADAGIVAAPDAPVGIDRYARPDVAMLVMNHENGNRIEIPQLVWSDPADATPDGQAINRRILAFADGYREYLEGNPEGYACSIEATAHFINMYVVIAMRRAMRGAPPEIAAFSYNYVLGWGGSQAGMTDPAMSWEEIAAKVTAAAAASAPEIEVKGCELAGYVWADFADVFFYAVTVGESVQSWAYVEKPLFGKPGDVMPGDEAFALLKKRYPDLPPDFDKAGRDAPAPYLTIVQPSESSGDGRGWSYTAGGDGAVRGMEQDEYRAQQWHEAEAEGVAIILDEPAPGTWPFYFRGEKPGVVTLHFIYADPSRPGVPPEYESVCRVEVLDDLALRLLDREDIGAE